MLNSNLNMWISNKRILAHEEWRESCLHGVLYDQLMILECVSFFVAKQGLLVVTQASKYGSPLTSLVIIQASKKKGQGNPVNEENQSG